jgi:hypothetical protein
MSSRMVIMSGIEKEYEELKKKHNELYLHYSAVIRRLTEIQQENLELRRLIKLLGVIQ